MEKEPESRLREIPYNYTSLADREIVIRLLGEPLWDVLDELRAERRTGRSARMLYEVLGDIWVVRAQSLPAGRSARQSQAPARAHRGAAAPLREVEKRRDAGDAGARRQGAASCCARPRAGGGAIRAAIRRHCGQAQARAALLRRHTRADNIRFDAFSRVSHVTDATDWRVEYPVRGADAGHRRRRFRAGARLHRAGTDHHSARRRHRLYRRRRAARRPGRRSSTPRSSKRLGEVETLALPGNATATAPRIFSAAGVVTKRVSEAAERAGFVFAVDPTSADASCVGGNIAMNAGGKKAVLWGTAVDNLAWWRMVDAQGNWLEVTRLDHNLGKIHDADVAELRAGLEGRQQGRREARVTAHASASTSTGAKFRKIGLGKDVTDKFLGGLPGVQKEGCDGLITAARWILHRMPKHTRTVCLEFFGQAREAIPSIVEIERYLAGERQTQRHAAGRPRASGRALFARRRLQHQIQARRAAENGAARRYRRRG